MEYTVTQFREENEEEVLDLHALLLRSDREFSRAYLTWKYRSNPFLTGPLIFLVRHNSKAVGMRGLYGTCWWLGPGRERSVLPHADDLIIHPDYRNRGLFLPIHQATVGAARDAGFPAIISLSGGEITQKISLLAGWTEMGELPRRYRNGVQPYRTGPAFLLRLVRAGLRRIAPERVRRPPGSSSRRLPSDEEVDAVLRSMLRRRSRHLRAFREPDLPGMSTLAEATVAGAFRAPRSEAFLRWRLGNPARRYRVLTWQDSRLRGFLILAWTQWNPLAIMVADYAVEDDAVLAELLGVVTRSRLPELVLLDATLPEAHRSLAVDMGFQFERESGAAERGRFLLYAVAGKNGGEGSVPPASSFPGSWRVGLLDTMAS